MTRNHQIALVINFLIDGEELMPWKHKTYSEEKFIFYGDIRFPKTLLPAYQWARRQILDVRNIEIKNF
jgi:hypothetical protein